MDLPGSYWLDAEPRPPGPALEGVAHADVLVVGGGIAAAFLALHLAEAGASVVVLEGDRIGWGATGRNAGFLLADGAETYARVARTMDDEVALRLRTLGALTAACVARVAEDEDVGLRVRGSIRLAADDVERKDLAETARVLGGGLRFLEEDALPGAYRGRGFRAALVEPTDGEVHPLRLVRATFRRAVAEGARVFERSRVLSLDEGSGAVRASTAQGIAEADVAVVATNAWIPDLLPEGPVVRPVRAQMLAARLDPAPDWAMPAYAREGADYWRLLPDGTALVGGRRRDGADDEETDDARPGERVQRALDRMLASLVAPGTRVDVLARWAGTMGFSPDGLPSAGPAPGRERTWVIGGFTGHGMGWGAGLAALLAERLLGRAMGPADCFSPSREAVRARRAGT